MVQGTIPGHELEYQLDVDHTFEKGRIVNVCGNTAAILGEGGLSWLAPHFHVIPLPPASPPSRFAPALPKLPMGGLPALRAHNSPSDVASGFPAPDFLCRTISTHALAKMCFSVCFTQWWAQQWDPTKGFSVVVGLQPAGMVSACCCGSAWCRRTGPLGKCPLVEGALKVCGSWDVS